MIKKIKMKFLSWFEKPKFNKEEILLYADFCKIVKMKEGDLEEKFKNSDLELLKILFDKKTDTQGFIAKSNEKMYVAFRGTSKTGGMKEFWKDIRTSTKVKLIDFDLCVGAGKVHNGFLKAYKSIREEVFAFVKREKLPIQVVGHSLGGSLATLCASDLTERGFRVECCTFGAPKVGDPDFLFWTKIADMKLKRFVHKKDPIPNYPSSILIRDYRHVGEEYLINSGHCSCKNLKYHFMKEYVKALGN